ncbi:uncharacterized, partial [Tachysurus ichikawai]
MWSTSISQDSGSILIRIKCFLSAFNPQTRVCDIRDLEEKRSITIILIVYRGWRCG